jgi:hypothetical protein
MQSTLFSRGVVIRRIDYLGTTVGHGGTSRSPTRLQLPSVIQTPTLVTLECVLSAVKVTGLRATFFLESSALRPPLGA